MSAQKLNSANEGAGLPMLTVNDFPDAPTAIAGSAALYCFAIASGSLPPLASRPKGAAWVG